MFPTTLSREYAIAHERIGLTASQMKRIWLAPIDDSWMSDDEKHDLRAHFLREADTKNAFESAP